MSDWTHGYVTDIEYTSNFYPELAPILMHFNALSKNVVLPKASSVFNWLEIGCGNGLSTNALAACNSQSEFYAFDFNPVHVLNAQRMADEAGLKNVHFFDDSFADALQRDLPMMDFIVLHGIYSWVSKENQSLIVQLVQKLLKPGGAVYISYNCLPGWSGKAPLRHLMTQFAVRTGGPVADKVRAAKQFVNELQGLNLSYFKDNPSAKKMAERLQAHDAHYMAHEYMNADWNLFYSSDIAADLNSAKLSFACSAGLLENADELGLSKETIQRIAQESDPTMRELLKDFAKNQQFRRDIFVKGKRKYAPVEVEKIARESHFTLFVPRSSCMLTVQSSIGEIILPGEVYAPILDALAQQPLSLSAISELMQAPLHSAINAIVVLSAVGYVHAIDIDPDLSATTCLSFNKIVVQRALYGEPMAILVASRLRTAVPVSEIDQFFIAAQWENASDLAGAVWQKMRSLGKSLMRDGQAIKDEHENLIELKQREMVFLKETMPLLKTWGVL